MFLHFFFPPRCVFCGRICDKPLDMDKKEGEKRVCPYCHPEKRLREPERRRLNIESYTGFAPFNYEGPMRESILAFKFNAKKQYGPTLGTLLYENSADFLAEFRPEILVPVPLHPGKLAARGYNQAEVLAEGMLAAWRASEADATELPHIANALSRVKQTAAQKSLSAQIRRRNLEGAFALSATGREILPDARRILIVDDIFTTGATVFACAEVLKLASPEAEIRFLCLAAPELKEE